MRRVMLVLAVTALLMRGPAAFACSCVASDTRTHFKGSTLVFIGTAMATQTEPASIVHVDFSISELYKGTASEHVAIETPDSVAGCGIAFLPGQRYVVFARGGPGVVAKTSLCDGTTDDTHALAAAGYVRPVHRFGAGTQPVVPTVTHRSGGRALVIGLAGVLLLLAVGGVWKGRRGKVAQAGG